MDDAATTAEREAPSRSAPPDWDHVPFDVGCARCGHDLRGLTDPKCPACHLDFDWSDAVPIEHITCETCDYHLYGLTERRCPECGDEFEWDAVLAAFHRRKQMLFEYHWRTKPVRSLLATWWKSLRPGKLWAELDIHDPPAVRPLIAQVVIVAVVAWVLKVLLIGTWGWVADWHFGMYRRSGKPGLADWFQQVSDWAHEPDLYLIPPEILSRAALSVLSLLILQQTMRRHRVRNAHVLRVCAYAIPGLIIPALLVYQAYDFAVMLLGGWGLWYRAGHLLCDASVLVFAVWSIDQGYRKYLKIPHSLGIAITSQIIALLGMWILGLEVYDLRFR